MQLASPRASSFVNQARNDIMRMNQTVTEGMNNSLEVIGGRKDGWGNPDTTALNSKHRRDPNLTIQEIVNNVLKKPVFGFEGYEPKPTMGDNTIYKNPNTHVRAKAKRIMFCEEASKAKDKVPAADKY